MLVAELKIPHNLHSMYLGLYNLALTGDVSDGSYVNIVGIFLMTGSGFGNFNVF